MPMHNIEIAEIPAGRLTDVIGQERYDALHEAARATREALDGHRVWNINATAQGGGVAEMLPVLLGYVRAAGIDARWLVLDGEPPFFAVTKRLHNLLHGEPGDGKGLGVADHGAFEAVTKSNFNDVKDLIQPGDVVIVHDPQPAGMLPLLREHGAIVVWRSHIGRDEPNQYTDLGWNFLQPYLEHAEKVIVTRPTYAPPGTPKDKLVFIAPSVDPFSPKNAQIPADDVAAVLAHVGILEGQAQSHDSPALEYHRPDGRRGLVRRLRNVVLDGGPLPQNVPVVLQVSRWDRLKDMGGVMKAFTDYSDADQHDAHLVLCGPAVEAVSDDPEGAEVLAECRALWHTLAPAMQARVHLVCVPMDDTDENAHIVNALQRYAQIVVQKSLREGFGLTVTEAMWKGRPVVASKIGGIQDQIGHDREGLLLPDPADLHRLGALLADLLKAPEKAEQLGAAAKQKVIQEFLGDRHLRQYADLITSLIKARAD